MISGHDIEKYIPQRPPFVFIDTIEETNANGARTRFTITDQCPLVQNSILPLAGLMENAAQTCATRIGNRIGFIGAVKQMEVTRFPHVGETICTNVTVLQEVLNISLVECITLVNNEAIATTTLKIAVMD